MEPMRALPSQRTLGLGETLVLTGRPVRTRLEPSCGPCCFSQLCQVVDMRSGSGKPLQCECLHGKGRPGGSHNKPPIRCKELLDFRSGGVIELEAIPMAKFKPGRSGNPKTTFKEGNRYRWQPGQSGNPAGIARSRYRWQPGQSGNPAGIAGSRLRLEESFYACLIDQGAADEAASLLWECARKPMALPEPPLEQRRSTCA